MIYLNFTLLVMVLLYTYSRLCSNPKREVFNPFFYITIFSAFYYLLGGFSAQVVNDILRLNISYESLLFGQFVSFYTVLLYLIFYFISNKINQKDYVFTLTNKETLLIKLLVIIIMCFCIVFLLKNMGKIIELTRTTSRVSAHESYNILVRGVPLGTLFFLQVVMLSLLLCARKISYVWYLTSFPVIIISLSSGSRTYLSIVMTAVFISSVYIQPKGLKKKLLIGICCLALLLASTFVGGNNFSETLYSSSAEFAHTYLTIPYLYDRGLLGNGDTLVYYTNPLVKVFGLSTELVYFGEEIHNIMNTPFSLAGNNITEALYYLGVYGVFFYPFIISLFFLFLIAQRKEKKYMFILTFMLCLYMRTFVRGAAYQSITMLLTYLIIFMFLFSLVKIIPSKRNEFR